MDDNLEERKKCSNSIRSRCKKLRYQEKQRGEIGEPEQSCSKENRINLWGTPFINLTFIHFKSFFFLIKQKKNVVRVSSGSKNRDRKYLWLDIEKKSFGLLSTANLC